MHLRSIVLAALVVLVLGGGYIWYAHTHTAPLSGVPARGDQATSTSKLNIDVVCEGALAYMTFPDGASADKFVAECKAGEHPEVIERYKADHTLNGAAI